MLERKPQRRTEPAVLKNIERTEELLQESEELRQCWNQIFQVNLWSFTDPRYTNLSHIENSNDRQLSCRINSAQNFPEL